MNGLKIRKLAAVVAGGALLGAAVAPMVSAQITSAEAKSVVYNADMSPVVNIVVGQTAAVSDGVWAGNIARKVVEKAVMTKSFAPGQGGSGNVVVSDLAAVLSLGGQVTVTGGKIFDNANLNSAASSASEYGQSITEDPLSFLKDETVSYRYNGSTTSIDVKETIGVQLDAKFDTDNDVRDLVADIAAGDINYTLSLGAGIPLGSTDASTADFEDGSDDNIRIPFFGKNYLVQSVDISSSRSVVELRLIEDKAKQTFVAGESFTVPGTGQYDGQTLTVTLVSIVATGPAAASFQAKFNLTDEAGNLIDTQTVEAGQFVEFEDSDGDEVTSSDVYIDAASVNTGTNEGTADLLIGTASVRLLDGENYPYVESIDQDNIEGPYTVTLNENTDTNRLTSIVISNQEKDTDDDSDSQKTVDGWGDSVFNQDHPLYSKNSALTAAGEDGPYEFSFLDGTGALGEDFFKITFNGFEQDEDLTYVQIGNNEVMFRDAQDSTHTIPMWWKEEQVTGSAVSGAGSGKKMTFDGGQELWYDLNTSSQDFNIVNGTLLNGVAVTYTGTTGILQTDNGAVDTNTAAAVTLNGVTYTVMGHGTAGVGLRADGWIRVADSELSSSVSTTDIVSGLGGQSNPTKAVSGMTAAQLTGVFFYDDANASSGFIGASTAPMLLPLSGDNYNVAYSFFVSETGSNSTDDGVYFLLHGDGMTAQHTSLAGIQRIPNGSSLQNSKNFGFIGTDTGEDGSVDRNFYFPQIDDLGQDDSSTTVFSSVFAVDENATTTYSAKVYIDNQTDDISNTDDTDISYPTSDVNYGWTGTGINGIHFTLDYEDSDSLEKAWTDWGTKISIADHKTAEFWIPENRPQIEFVVSGASTTSTVEGGEEITVDEGDTGTFTTGTQISVKDITYTATVAGGSSVVTNGAPGTYMTPAPLNGKAQVYTTGSSVPGPKIIVGGPLVNSLAQEVADMLNASGDMVSGVYSGNIIVAGYTAEDTGMAAQDLISALDSI